MSKDEPIESLATIPPGPWDRRPGEPSRAYSALVLYLQMGPERTYAKMNKLYHYNIDTLYRWNAKYGWRDRIAAYDEYMNREIMGRLQSGIAEMCERHIEEARLLQSKAIDKLSNISPDELFPADIAKFLDAAIKIERQSRGAADQPNINITATANSNSGDMLKVLVNVVLDTVEDPNIREQIADKLHKVMAIEDNDG